MKKISVIIPCFNAALYIERCLNALEKQSYQDFNVIIVDDCSTDTTKCVIEQYQKKSKLDIVLMENQVNSGPAASRNRGIQKSDAEYVTFCDSDDWYEQDFLEKMITALEHNKADIAFCGYRVVNEKEEVSFRTLKGAAIIEDPKEALSLNVDSMCMLMIRREIMKKCPWPDIRNGEDMALIPLLICSSKKYCVLEECLYNYLTRATSASNILNSKVIDALEQSFLFIKEHMPKEYDTEVEYIGLNNWLYAGLITLFSIGFDTKRAKRILDDFEQVYPKWHCNPLYRNIAGYKQVILFLARKRMFIMIRMIAIVRMARKKK